MNPPRPLQKVLFGAIRLYQGFRVGRLSHCRFQPTCSEYAAEAISTRGPVVGTLYAARRIARCHPLGGHGFDPVPSK